MLTLVVVVAFGGVAYYALAGGLIQSSEPLTNSVLANQDILSSQVVAAYACSKPAVDSQNFCDQLPSGYHIAAKLVNGPAAYCRAGMTDSACDLLKKTYGNGVCDPNETGPTSPLDCGCTGALSSDPYTGRCALAASVCQLQVLQEATQQNNP